MPLYRNNELVTKLTDPAIFEEIEKITLSIKKGKQYVFQTKRKLGWSKNKDGKMIKNPPRLETVPIESTTEEESGASETWRWIEFASQARNVAGVITFTGSRNLKFGEQEIYTNPELIWFLLNKSLKYKKGKIFLADPEKIEQEKTEKRTAEAEVYNLIYSKQSPLSISISGDDTAMKKMAASFGVTGVDKKPYNKTQNELWDIIKANENVKRKTGKGFKEFLKELNQEKTADRRANIMLAIDRGMLVYKDLTWKLVMKGGAEQPIYTIAIGDEERKTDLLIDFLEHEDRWYPLVVESLQSVPYNKGKGPDLKISLSTLKTKDDLNPYCETYKVPLHGRKFIDVKTDLLKAAPEVFKE